MANSTVYPYGTGGSLPSSIGLVNDLKTGGADKALAAAQGPAILQQIEDAKGSEWETKDIEATWTSGALVALATDADFNTLLSDNSWKTTGYIEVDENYTHIYYHSPQDTSNTSKATKCGLIFYDANQDPVMGFAGGYGTAVSGPWYHVPVPADAKYVRISTWSSSIWEGTLHNQWARISGHGADKAAVEGLSSLGFVGPALAFTVASGDNSTVIRNIIGNFVTEYRIGTVAFANRMNIDVSGRDFKKYYIFRFKYSCTRDVPSNVYVCLKDSDNNRLEFMGAPTKLPGTSRSQLYLNGARSGEFIGIIPPGYEKGVYVTIDTQNLTAKARMEYSDISINEIDLSYNFDKGTVPLWRTPIEYAGEKVRLQSRAFAEEYMTATPFSNKQAMCCFGDYAFLFTDKGGSIAVINMRTRTVVDTVSMSGAFANDSNHCNTASFSSLYYQEGDEFPILYVSSGKKVDGYPRAYGLRIVKTVDGDTVTFAITLVHTVTLNYASWAEFVWAGKWLYVRYEPDGGNVWGKAVAPSASADATIDPEDLMDTVAFSDYLHKDLAIDTQGYFHLNGRIYTVWGTSAPFYFGAVDPGTGKIVTLIDLAELSITNEPESVFLWDGNLYINCYNGKIFRLFFD